MKGIVNGHKFNTEEDDVVYATSFFSSDGQYVKETLYQEYWMGFFYLYSERNKLGCAEFQPVRRNVLFYTDKEARMWLERIQSGNITRK